MNTDDPKFTAYALGEMEDLTAEDRAEIEALLASDTMAAAEAAEMRALAGRLRVELPGEEANSLLRYQRAAILSEVGAAVPAAKVIRFPRRALWWSAAAACVIVSASIALLFPSFRAEKEAAQRTLARTLPASTDAAGGLVSNLGTVAPNENVLAAPTVALDVYALTGPAMASAQPSHTSTFQMQTAVALSTPRPAHQAASESRAYRTVPVDRLAAPMNPSLSTQSPTGGAGLEIEMLGRGQTSGWRVGGSSGSMGEKVRGEGTLAGESANTASYDALAENDFLTVRDNPLSTFSTDVDTASYSIVRRFLTQNQRPPRGAVRIEEMLNYFTYDYALPQGDVPFSAAMEATACPWNPEHRLVRIGLKGREIAKDKRPASNLVFLIDVSGSMQPGNKLPLLKQSLGLLIDQLGGEDRVSMVVYAGSSGCVLEPTNDKREMQAALQKLEAGGSTNGASGLDLAYELAQKGFIKGGTNRVILATDGDWNVGMINQSDLLDLIAQKAKGGVFLTVLGFGMGNLKDSMMVKLADRGNGNYAYIDTLLEAKKVLVEQLSGTLVTIAKDVKIQVEFNPSQVGAYRLIGYEKRVLAKEDFNNDKKDAGEIGAGHTVTALYEVVPAGRELLAMGNRVDALKYQPAPAAPAAPPLLRPERAPQDGKPELLPPHNPAPPVPPAEPAPKTVRPYLLDQESKERANTPVDGGDKLAMVPALREARKSAIVDKSEGAQIRKQLADAPVTVASDSQPKLKEDVSALNRGALASVPQKAAPAPISIVRNTSEVSGKVSGEMLTLKLRYKEPEGDTSKLLEFPLTDSGAPWERSSRDLRFAAAVAGYGMLLRDSPHKGQATWGAVAEWAQEGLGTDGSGYRAEFLALIEKAKAVTR